MKKGFFVAALVAALAATAAAFGGNAPARSGPTATAGPDTALIRCGRTRTIGVAAPVTGPAASIGAQQARWARYFVTRYNRVEQEEEVPRRRR